MQKIPTLFIRDPKDMSRVLSDVTPGAEWVLKGEGVPTRKRDGTNVRITLKSGKVEMLEKRRNPSREDRAAGAEPGYVQAEPADPGDKHIFAAVAGTVLDWCPDGAWSCEALGPKIQGGVEGVPASLYMFLQKPDVLADFERTFDGIRDFLAANVLEGIVWHHPDGRFAKIKRRDFGFRWPERK